MERIRSLTCWHGEVDIRELPGGITNQNFLVTDSQWKYVVRICEDRRYLGIDRHNERTCQLAAHSAGLAPEMLYHEDDLFVSRLIEGRSLTEQDISDERILVRLARTLRQLHDAQHQHTGEMLYFCPFQTVRTYTATAQRLNAALPADMSDLLDDAAKLARRMRLFRPVMCHNDLLPANILDDGQQLWLVDWEYAGVGNPLFDIASISANGAMTDDMERDCLQVYLPTSSQRDLTEVKILKTISLLREALWGMIQAVVSEIDFDYGQYASKNLAAYRLARKQLDAR